MRRKGFNSKVYKIYNDLVLIDTASINSREELIGVSLLRNRVREFNSDIKYADYWIVDKRKFK